VRFEVFTAVFMRDFVSWNITPSTPLKVKRRFGGAETIGVPTISFHSCFLLALVFDPKNWDDIILRNFGWHSKDYTLLYARIQNSSLLPLWAHHILQHWDWCGCTGNVSCVVIRPMAECTRTSMHFFNAISHIFLSLSSSDAVLYVTHLCIVESHVLGEWYFFWEDLIIKVTVRSIFNIFMKIRDIVISECDLLHCNLVFYFLLRTLIYNVLA
jgi:hypothetical protein